MALAERDPSRNYLGIDIKGARMWRGAKTATERGMANVGFLRTRIEFINSLFAEGRSPNLDHLPDPQLKTRRAKNDSPRRSSSNTTPGCCGPTASSTSKPIRNTSMPTPTR